MWAEGAPVCVCVHVLGVRSCGCVPPHSVCPLPQLGWRCLRTQAEPLSRLVAVRNIKYHPKFKKNKHREVKKYNL